MLFEDTPKALTEKIELIVRLIRSKGVGVYFITQSPTDIPDEILGQLGNRIQHALRAFTPRDQRVVRAAAETFRANSSFDTATAIMELGTGEALVSFLDSKGAPSVVERAKIMFPLGSIGAISAAQRESIVRQSRLFGMYERFFDRESAYEMLSHEEQLRLKREQEAKREQEIRKESTSAKKRVNSSSAFDKAFNSAATSIGRNVGTQIARGILGAIFKK